MEVPYLASDSQLTQVVVPDIIPFSPFLFYKVLPSTMTERLIFLPFQWFRLA